MKIKDIELDNEYGLTEDQLSLCHKMLREASDACDDEPYILPLEVKAEGTADEVKALAAIMDIAISKSNGSPAHFESNVVEYIDHLATLVCFRTRDIASMWVKENVNSEKLHEFELFMDKSTAY